MDGNEGFLFLINRNKGDAITITLWGSEANVYSTSERAEKIRQQTAAASGLRIQGVEHYEVVRNEQEKRRAGTPTPVRARLEGEGTSLYARVSFYHFPKEGDIDAAVESFDKSIPAVREMAGNQGLKFMIDRHKGKVMAVTLWDSPLALKLSSQLSNSVSQQTAGMSGLTIQGVEHYEVAKVEH